MAKNPFFPVVFFVKIGSYGFVIPLFFIKMGNLPIKRADRGKRDFRKKRKKRSREMAPLCFGFGWVCSPLGRHKNSFAVFAHGAHNGVPRCYPPGQSMATCFSAVGCLGFPPAGVSWNCFRSLCAWGTRWAPIATRRGSPWRVTFQSLGAWGCRPPGFHEAAFAVFVCAGT